jgi:alpha-beta hydrolase superfamily lysophospholipase
MAAYVLVHGGGHGGWCYQRVARILRSPGHDVYTRRCRASVSGHLDRLGGWRLAPQLLVDQLAALAPLAHYSGVPVTLHRVAGPLP